MRIAKVWNGKEWAKKDDYKKTCLFTMYEGKALYIDPMVWDMPKFDISDNSAFTGSKVVLQNTSIQFRFTVNASNTALKDYVRRYLLGVARNEMTTKKTQGMLMNLQRVGNNFTFETSFCGSASPIAGFLKALKGFDGQAFSTIYFRYRQEDDTDTKTISKWYKVKFEDATAFKGIVRLVRDEGDKGYTDFTNKYVVTHQGIYKVAFK